MNEPQQEKKRQNFEKYLGEVLGTWETLSL